MSKAKKQKRKTKMVKRKKIKSVKRRKILVRPPKRHKKVISKKVRKAPRKTRKPARKVVAKVFKVKKIKKIIKKAKIVKVKKHRAKRSVISLAEPFAVESLFKAKIKVIGIGGGGGSIVSEIGKSLEKATFVIADTDFRALKKKSGIKYFWFGEELTHGLGTGVNVDLAKRAAESAKEKISSFFEDQDIIIFVASLGGGLGSGATQVFAEIAKQFGGITLGIFTMPFKFEGKNKQRIAQNALKSLRKSLNVSLVIPNEKIFKIIDESTPITNAFSTVNKSLIGSLESLIDLIYNPGIINIDFADLRTILKGRGNSAFLNTVEESGKDKVEKICENIFKNPLLQNSSFKAEKILFNIAGSEDLSMFQVEKISSHISSLNPEAKIIFGISKNSKLKNKIKTTILMTGGQIQENVIIKEKEPEKVVVAEKPVEKSSKKIVKKAKKPVGLQKKKENLDKKKIKKEKPLKNPSVREDKKPVSFIPVFETQKQTLPILEQRRSDVNQTIELNKNVSVARQGVIRRSGLEIKKAEELQEEKKLAQEKEWEIPAFLRKVKFKS